MQSAVPQTFVAVAALQLGHTGERLAVGAGTRYVELTGSS